MSHFLAVSGHLLDSPFLLKQERAPVVALVLQAGVCAKLVCFEWFLNIFSVLDHLSKRQNKFLSNEFHYK